jgi:hypothetical protein
VADHGAIEQVGRAPLHDPDGNTNRDRHLARTETGRSQAGRDGNLPVAGQLPDRPVSLQHLERSVGAHLFLPQCLDDLEATEAGPPSLPRSHNDRVVRPIEKA